MANRLAMRVVKPGARQDWAMKPSWEYCILVRLPEIFYSPTYSPPTPHHLPSPSPPPPPPPPLLQFGYLSHLAAPYLHTITSIFSLFVYFSTFLLFFFFLLILPADLLSHYHHIFLYLPGFSPFSSFVMFRFPTRDPIFLYSLVTLSSAKQITSFTL